MGGSYGDKLIRNAESPVNDIKEYYLLHFWREGMEDFVEYGDREGEGRLLRANTNTYQAVEQVLEGEGVIASKVR